MPFGEAEQMVFGIVTGDDDEVSVRYIPDWLRTIISYLHDE